MYPCHAKAAVLINDDFAVSIATSANLTNNPRIEVYVIVDDPDIAEFHKTWIEKGLERGDNFNDQVKFL